MTFALRPEWELTIQALQEGSARRGQSPDALGGGRCGGYKKNIRVCNKLSKIESSVNKRFNELIYVCVVEGVGKVEMT